MLFMGSAGKRQRRREFMDGRSWIWYASAESIFIMRMDFPNKGELSSEFARNCQNCTTVRDLFEYLLDFLLEKINHMISQREEDAVRPVRLAKQFIHNHYQEQITLEEVSEYVGLTPAYFSVMFKKETEIGFAKYLMSETY